MIKLHEVVPEYQHEIEVIDFALTVNYGFFHVSGISKKGAFINIPFPGYHFPAERYPEAIEKLEAMSDRLKELQSQKKAVSS